MKLIRVFSIFLVMAISFAFKPSKSIITKAIVCGKDTNYFDTKAWSSQKLDYDKANIKAMFNDN